jgi:HAE1 family hydrophobic/amphiphilic exporter-1
VNVSAAFIRRPIGTTLLSLAILLVGVAAFPLLPVAPLPQVDFPTIQVSAALPGASPETMASNVAQPLERQFSLIAGLSQMTSVNSSGSTQVTLQFDLDRNIDAAAQDVQAAITAAGGQLPTSLPGPPTLRKINPADSPILIVATQSDTLPLTEVDDYAENILAQQISQISGVGLVNVSGQQKPAIRVQVDPTRVASLGLGLEDIRSVLGAMSVNQPKGSIDSPTQSFTLYTNDQLLRAKPWNDVVLAWRNGAPIRVRDVGIAVDGPENTKVAAWAYSGGGASPAFKAAVHDGRAVVLLVTKQPGANVIQTVDQIKAALPRLRAALPPSIAVNVVRDATQTIRGSVHEVEFTLALTIALVVGVIFLFLRNLAATLIPSVTVPLALAGTAAVMYLVGYSLDNLSLMALTIAVGFVVDDAIVMLENIYRHVELGMTPMEAAYKGAGEIGFTILSISISLVAVFIPLLLMGGIVGRLFREFAVTVTLAIVVSVVVSLTLTPMLCARFLRNEHAATHGPLHQAFERGFDRLLDAYRRGLDVVLRHQFATLWVFLATAAFTGVLFVVVPKGFFPQQDTGYISGFAETSQDASYPATVARMLKLADVVRQDPDIAGFNASTGTGGANTGSFNLALKDKEDGRKASADEVIARLRSKLAAVEGASLFLQAAQDVRIGGRSARTQYQYTLTDSDIDELDTWAPKLLARFRDMPELADVASDQQSNAAAAVVTIDRDRAASFGITPAAIDSTLYDAVGQRQVAQYFTQVNSYHVVLEVTPRLQSDPALLGKIFINSPLTGQPVPLSTFVSVDTSRAAYLSINHQGQYPAVTLSFNLAPGVALGQAVAAVDQAMAQLGAPQTLSGAFQGSAQAFRDSLASQPWLIAAALVAVYIVLGLLYESAIHPLTILSTLPSAGVGALLILMAGGYDLGVIALIGIILLIGIVKKNGIMMVDFALTAERDDGLSPQEAIRQACLLRFRPIMMTTLCALLGGLPLMLGHGAGSELRRPLGYAMVGGLVLSQALTLFTTPVVYLYLDRAHRWYAQRLAARQARRAGHAALAAHTLGQRSPQAVQESVGTLEMHSGVVPATPHPPAAIAAEA